MAIQAPDLPLNPLMATRPPGLGSSERVRLAAMAAVVLGLLGSGALLLVLASPHHYRVSGSAVFGLGTGLLALTLGMRHAFDADHIAAIDNTTRKLMAEGRRPMSVGFFFSLGHSTVVFVLTMLLVAGIHSLGSAVADQHSTLQHVTGVLGTSISGLSLYAIAAINVEILCSMVRAFGDLRTGRYDEDEVERRLAQRGLMNRILGSSDPWRAGWMSRGRCTRSGSSSASASTLLPRWGCWSSRARR